MTREELKVHCEKQIKQCEMWAKYKGENPSGKIYEEHKLILELLEQEPCEDAISIQAVLDKKELVELEDGQSFYCISPEDVETLPSVTPQPKTEWQQDHEILKAYSDGANEVLDKIRAEIEFEVDNRTNMLCAEDVLAIIDKYTESEGTNASSH